MKHAKQILNYEKRKLINRLYEMQHDNDFGRASHTDDEFQAIKKKISQVSDAIKLIEANDKKGKGKEPIPPSPRVRKEVFGTL